MSDTTRISQSSYLEDDPHWVQYSEQVLKRIRRNEYGLAKMTAEDAFKAGIGYGYQAGTGRPKHTRTITVELSPSEEHLIHALRSTAL